MSLEMRLRDALQHLEAAKRIAEQKRQHFRNHRHLLPGYDYAEAADLVEELSQQYEAMCMEWQALEMAKTDKEWLNA